MRIIKDSSIQDKFNFFFNKLDVKGFQSLRERSSMPPLCDRLLQKAINGSLLTLCAFSGEDLAGMSRVVGDGAFVFLIYDVLVAPEYRERGLGSELVKMSVSAIKTLLPEGMWVTVNLFSSPGREGFYQRFGFQTLPSEYFGSGMQLIVKAIGGIENLP